VGALHLRLAAASENFRDSGDLPSSMTELEIPDKARLSAREKRDAQRAQLRPLANLRP
jgi:hypothetical protein